MIMRNLYKHITLLILVVAVSCQERHPALFDEISGVYFNNLSGTMSVTDSLDYTFVYEAGDELEVPVKVQLVGRPSGQDRPLSITVTSENAVEGEDYILPEYAIMPAGASRTDYLIKLRRTPALKSERKMLSLEIKANEYFTLPVTEMVQTADTVSTLSCRIYFSDMFTKAPTAWDSNLIGEFSQQKFELACRVLDIDPGDFNDVTVITLAKQLFISKEMTDYINEQIEKKAEGMDYDTEAFDEEGDPLIFTTIV